MKMRSFQFAAASVMALLALGWAGCSRQQQPAAAPAPAAAAPALAAAAPAPVAVPVTPPAPAAAAARGPAAPVEEEGDSGEPAGGRSPVAAAAKASAPAPAAKIPSNWVEGKSYTRLVPAQPTSVAPDKVEVVEVFWYGCGHCFHFEPTLVAWSKKDKPAYVQFVRVPVMWNDVTRAHARLFYTLEALDKLEALHAVVFREIHVNNNLLVDRDPEKTEQVHRAFLKANGVPEAEFDRTYRSFSVESKLQRAEQLTHRYKVTGVPVMVINGKYTADVGTTGGEVQLITLVNDLAASEHKR